MHYEFHRKISLKFLIFFISVAGRVGSESPWVRAARVRKSVGRVGSGFFSDPRVGQVVQWVWSGPKM